MIERKRMQKEDTEVREKTNLEAFNLKEKGRDHKSAEGNITMGTVLCLF